MKMLAEAGAHVNFLCSWLTSPVLCCFSCCHHPLHPHHHHQISFRAFDVSSVWASMVLAQVALHIRRRAPPGAEVTE